MTTIAELIIKVDTSQLDAAKRSMDSLNASTTKISSTAQKDTRVAGDSFQKLAESIDPVRKRLRELADQQTALKTAFASGNPAAIANYNQLNTIIERNIKQINALGASTGKTAKEINFAMRGLPAQFTDIFVSLQAGQAPLTVFLQQGGQLKDMFGGVGPAARAMGGYIAGLVNPFTIAAAAIGTFAVAMYSASKEQTDFNKAVIQGGGFAGTSYNDFLKYQKQLDGIAGTAGQAATALNQLQKSGVIAGEAFVGIAAAAIKMEKATGTAIEETIADFVSLAKDPAEAAVKLDEKYRFLTSSVLAQVKSLELQGRQQEAVLLIQRELTTAIDEAANKMIDAGGLVEKSWAGIKTVVTETWDAIKSVGRDKSLDEQIENTKKLLEGRRTGLLAFVFDSESGRNSTAFLENRLQILLKAKEAQDNLSESERDAEIIRRQGTSITQANTAAYISNIATIDKVKAAQTELDRVRANGEKLVAAAKAENRKLTEDEIRFQDAAVKAAEKRLKDTEEAEKKRNKPDRVTQDAAEKLLNTYEQQRVAIEQRIQTSAKAGSEEVKLSKLIAQLATIEEKAKTKALTVDEKSLLANKDKLIAAQKENVEQEKILKAKESQAKLDSFRATLQAQIAANEKKYADAVLGIGRGKTEIARMKERNALEDEYIKKLEDINKLRLAGSISPEDYDRAVADQKRALEEERRNLERHFEEMDKARSDWVNGATSAWEDYLDGIRDVSSQSYDLFTNAFKGIEDYLVSFVMGTKASFKDLVRSIAADLARIGVRNFIGSIFGGVSGAQGQGGGLLGGLFSGWSGGGSSGGIGFGNLLSVGQSVYSALTGWGPAAMAGWQAGGLGGALGGVGSYYGGMLSGAASTIGGWLGLGGASAASSAAAGTGFGLGGSLVSGGIGSASYAAGAGGIGSAISGALSSMASMWYLAPLLGMWQSGKLYSAGVRPDMKEMWGSTQGNALGKIGNVAPTLMSGFYKGLDSILEPVVGGKLAAMITGSTFHQALWGGINKKLFGSGWQTKDVGIALGLDQGELDAKQFEYQKKKGGLFSKGGKRTRYSDLDEETLAVLQETYANTRMGVESLFKELSFNIEDGALSGLTVAKENISTMGKTQEEIQEAISNWFAKTADTLTMEFNKIFGTGLEYNFEQMQEFVGNLVTLNAALESINKASFDASVEGGKLAESMSAIGGGLDNLISNVNTYYQAFIPANERVQDSVDSLRKQMEDLGTTLPKNRELFQRLIEGIDVTTESGQKLFAGLVALSGAADQYYQTMEQLESAYYQAFTPAVQQNEEAIKALKDEMFKLGYTNLPQTRQAFMDIVNSSYLASDAGQDLRRSLLSLAPAMDQYIGSLENQRLTMQNAQFSVADTIGGLRNTVMFGALESDESRYAYLKSQIDAMATLLPNVQDIDSITNLVNQITSLSGQAYGLLDPQGQKEQTRELLAFLDKIQEQANEQISKADQERSEEQARILGEVLSEVGENIISDLGRVVNQVEYDRINAFAITQSLAQQIQAALTRLVSQGDNGVVYSR